MKIKIVVLLGILFFLICPKSLVANTNCTGITLNSSDGSFIHARTMEWGAFNIKPELLVFPRNYAFEGQLPIDKPGMKWEGKYGFIGINALGDTRVADGLNEKGLAVSVLYLPGYASYQAFDSTAVDSTISPSEFPLLLLSTCQSVKEVRVILNKVKVVGKPEKELGGIVAPFHYMVSDQTGESVIVEYTKEELHIYDNAVGVITNSPEYPWHLTNLKNYITLKTEEAHPVNVGELTLKPFGAGSGMLGLPGDYTPPSRFVRATVMRNSVIELEDGERAISEAFRILNNFDIPIGTMGVDHDPSVLGDTQYTTAADTKSMRYYYRTMNNHRIRVLDLKKIDFTSKELTRRPLDIELAQDYEFIEIETSK